MLISVRVKVLHMIFIFMKEIADVCYRFITSWYRLS